MNSPSKRILAIDYGLARIGMAISDPMGFFPTPLPTLLCGKKLAQTTQRVAARIREVCEEKGCLLEKIVVGLPLLLSGEVGHLADEVALFIEKLREEVDVPIETWDERLTSRQAERTLQEGGRTRKQRAAEVDSVSALLILQSYLNWLHRI